jgi:hypothetical protein
VPSFSLKATLRKISRSYGEEPRPSSSKATAPRPRTSSFADLLNKTARIAPRPYPSTRAQLGGILPDHSNPDATTPTATWPKPPRSSSTSQDAPPTRRTRYTNSLSRASGVSYKKTAAATPVLSQAPAHAHDITNPKQTVRGHNTGSSETMSMSWGRRAAAAALDIGRRFKGRKTSSSFSSSACAFPSAAQLGASAPAAALGPAHTTQPASLRTGRAAGLILVGDTTMVGKERSESKEGGLSHGTDPGPGTTAPALLPAGRQRGE